MTIRLHHVDFLPAGNRFHVDPVMLVSVDGDMPSPREIARIAETLQEFAAQRGASAAPETPAGLVADLSIALLQRALDPGRFRCELAAADGAIGTVVFTCRNATVGRQALDLALSLLEPQGSHDLSARLARFVRWSEGHGIFPDDIYMAEAADARGVFWRLSASGKREILVGEGARTRRTLANLTDRTGLFGMSIALSKDLTNRALRRAGLPATRQMRASTEDEAIGAAEAIGYPVVVKPVAASKGVGVACDLARPEEVARAFREARAYGGVLVENYLNGDDHRLLVIDGRFVRCTQRMRARVIGDGVRTVEALVALENTRDERQPSPGRRFMTISLDAETDRILGRQGLDRRSVPTAGRPVLLRPAANWTFGGMARLATDDAHPDNIRLAEHVARLFGLDIVGVDMITDDISRSFRETGARINEVQSQPAIGAQRRALGPTAPKLHEALLAGLLPADGDSRVPIFAVMGPDGPAVMRGLSERLASSGHAVGIAWSAGLEVQGRRLSGDDHRGRRGLPTLVDDPTVSAILVEVDPGDVASIGLGHGRLDVVVSTGPAVGEGLDALVSFADAGIVCRIGDRDAAMAAADAGKRCVTIPDDAPSGAAARGHHLPALADRYVAAAIGLCGRAVERREGQWRS